MSIERHFDRRIVIKRVETVSGNRKNFVSTGTIDAHIQLLTEEYSEKLPMVFGATHKAWCGIDENVSEGDKVLDDRGFTYTVVTVNIQQHGSQEHLEVILKRVLN